MDLSGIQSPATAPTCSALKAARIIDDLGRINYPEGIQSPKVELNINAKQGKFRQAVYATLCVLVADCCSQV